MKKIIEIDLKHTVKRILNEQKNKQFNGDEIELIHFIFERELKPPFTNGEKYSRDRHSYYNRDNEIIGWLSAAIKFSIRPDYFLSNIKYKICQVFEFPYDTRDWWIAIKSHIKSWMGNQLNLKLRRMG